MSILNKVINNKFFTVRNALFAVTSVLLIMVVLLSASNIITANNSKSKAETLMLVNDIVEDIAQLKLAVGMERTAISTAYGFEDTPPATFLDRFENQRRTVGFSIDSIHDNMSGLDPFEGVAKLITALDASYKAYDEKSNEVKNDIQSAKEDRINKRSTKIRNVYNELINKALALRIGIEAAYKPSNPQIALMTELKYKLWVMVEYSSQDAAAVGENIAAQKSISASNLERVSRYNGYIQGAWIQAEAIASSGILGEAIKASVPLIQAEFFGVETENGNKSGGQSFSETRDLVYEASDLEEEYPLTGAEWIDATQKAAGPINKMILNAGRLTKQLNQDAVSDANGDVVQETFVLLITIALGIVAFWVVIFRVVRPVNALSETMMELADGKLEVDIPNADRVDEMGSMARSVEIFKENALERRRLVEEQKTAEEAERQRQAEEEEAEHQRTEERRTEAAQAEEAARQANRQTMLDLADQFESAIMGIVDSVGVSASGMETAAQALTNIAENTSAQSGVVSQAATQASENSNMVASSAEELSASVREISGQTNQSSEKARDAVTRTETASNDISQLAIAANKISDVVNLINDIAEQTNLLALNATIEAARAGEAGRGFAVVASEVKNLANQTATATQEISDQVTGMQDATGQAVTAIDDIKAIISDIETTAVSIASAVEQQDASTQEIARNVGEVSAGTSEMTVNIQSVSQGAAETGQSAGQVLSAAQELTSQSNDLRTQVEGFLSKIRA